MKYLLTLLLVCPLAHTGDTTHPLINGLSPLGRPGTPLSRSMSLMPSITQPRHRRDRSKSHITEPAPSDEASPAFVPCPIALTRSTSTMLHALGGHRGGFVPQVAAVEQIPQPEFANPDEEIEELRQQNRALEERREKLEEMLQLHKDQGSLEVQMAKWAAKRAREKELAEREKYVASTMESLDAMAQSIIGMDNREQITKLACLTQQITTLTQQITTLTRQTEAMLTTQQEMQNQQRRFMANVELFTGQQRISAQLRDSSATSQSTKQDAAPASQPKKPSGRVGLSEFFSSK